MRPIDSAYDRMADRAYADAAKIISRLNDGEVIPYEEMDALDDMALDDIRATVHLVEVPGEGYLAG